MQPRWILAPDPAPASNGISWPDLCRSECIARLLQRRDFKCTDDVLSFLNPRLAALADRPASSGGDPVRNRGAITVCVSLATLMQALQDGDMPYTQQLIDSEGYAIHRYRCGVPSTTPFAQAGILYGDNSEIPSFRWWDRERRLLVQFGAGSTFKKVADKYFQGCLPLTLDSACIAA